jgi:nitrate reductase delta subunit
MMLSYKVLAALLTYPEAGLCAAARTGELLAVLEEERAFAPRQVARLQPLLAELADEDELDLQERYVGLFDRSKTRSLYLFEHNLGESRDRGTAMLELNRMYAEAGLELAANELPDYLPVFLEYLSLLDPATARQRLAQPVHIIARLARRLAERGSAYAPVFALLEELSAERPDAAALAEMLGEGDDDFEDAEQLDEEWREDPVTFGPAAAPGGEPPCQRMSRAVERLLSDDGHAAG